MVMEQRSDVFQLDGWYGSMLVDCEGAKIGKLSDVLVDGDTGAPRFAVVRGGFLDRRLTIVPLHGVEIEREHLRLIITRDLARSAPDVELVDDELSSSDETALCQHYGATFVGAPRGEDHPLVRLWGAWTSSPASS